ncbi:Transposon Tf2-9 polyprotein [Araneus ventricosus]|uniref:Transposon Tf2-9 polyprotein n=1 Tax=Araneus ventricosus TaxID=182803 RepID=A0A4Y2DRK2_ARAVE|nr:Transposon Tf2-9 polyprotein [Araneus ventricosus]
MDDLFQNAKQTAYMSTIDLKSGYHQVQVHPPDKDKTAFFAEISRSLSNLAKKRTSWKWVQDEQTAFERLKEKIVSPPVLKQVDETKPFVLRTDASNYALGAVLIQGKGEEEHPIEYASHLLTSSERNYSTAEREALAIV